MLDLVRSICLAAFAALLAGSGPAAGASGQGPAPVMAAIKAHPALWTVRSGTATAYLFGSIHLLPPNIDWHSRAIDAAVAASDIFVFEAPLGQSGEQQTVSFVRANGMLAPDTSLPSLLDARARRDYRAAILAAHVPPDSLVHLQPWLAAIVLQTHLLESLHYSPSSGVDRQLWAYATARKKQIETFETVDEQLALLMPKNPKVEMEEFDASLKEVRSDTSEIGALVDAWCDGRMGDVAKLMNEGLSATPGAMKLLIDDRNARWVNRLAGMLSEHHTYFVTVGAGHLAGPRGVPALLGARGYRVALSAPPR
ncbi:MAG: TraB/GumN family protein [Rhizomicrobium sp.]